MTCLVGFLLLAMQCAEEASKLRQCMNKADKKLPVVLRANSSTLHVRLGKTLWARPTLFRKKNMTVHGS